MQKLRASVYLKNNKKRALILIISFGLFFTLLYGVRFFIDPATYADEVLMVKTAEKMQIAYINSFTKVCDTLDNSLWEKGTEASEEEKIKELNRAGHLYIAELREQGLEGKVFLCNCYNMSVRTFIGNSTYYAPLLVKKEFDELMDYLQISVTKGRMPESSGEIIVDERMLKNLDKKIGDSVYNDRTKIVGVTKYPMYFAAGIDFEQDENPDRFLFFLNNGAIPDLADFFASRGIEASMDRFSEVEIIADKVNAVKEVDKFRDEIDLPLNVMTYSIFIVLAMTLFFVYRLHVQDRYSEWCLYRSLGYSAKEVFFLAFREYFICFLFSILFAGVTLTGMCLAGGAIMSQKGMMFRYLLPDTLLQMTGIVVLLSGVMQLPVVTAMKKVKTIDALDIE